MKFVYKGKTVPLEAYIIFRSGRAYNATENQIDRPAAWLGKVFLTMKLTALLFLIGTFQVLADNTYAQQVSMQKKDATLLEVLKSVRKQTGYLFICDLEMLSKADKVNINMNKATLKEVLDASFAKQPLTYNIVDKTIIVKKKKEAEPKPREEPEVKGAYPYFPDPGVKRRMTESCRKRSKRKLCLILLLKVK